MNVPLAKRPPSAVPSAPAAHADSLRTHLSAVYALSQNSRHVFASPLGPVVVGRRQTYLPRFVFFGPLASDV